MLEPDITPRMEQALLATCFRIGSGGSYAFGAVAAGATVSKVGWLIAGWIMMSGPDMIHLECGRRGEITLMDATILARSVGTRPNLGPYRLRQPCH